MKYLLILPLFLLTPLMAHAANSVHVIPPSIAECGVQDVEVSGTAHYDSPQIGKHLRLKLDGSTVHVFSSPDRPTNWSYTIEDVSVGTHIARVEMYFGIFVLDSSQRTFEVEPCEPPPPTDVCTNLDGDQATVPEGYEEEGGICTEIPEEPVDVCTNLDGVQENTPDGYNEEGGICTEIPDEGGGGGSDNDDNASSGRSGGHGSGLSAPWYYYPTDPENRDTLMELWAQNPILPNGATFRKTVIYMWCLKHFQESSCHLY